MMSENNRDNKLLEKLEQAITLGESIEAALETDERVIARVTDGIYRQPSSALRELIANAYDADATIVSLDTDAPRFDSIRVSDNGVGMSPETLVYVIRHIGGSAKRTSLGASLGMSGEDKSQTKLGRKFIGKIGIGLFSIAQLARQFRITTKTKGSKYQLMAHVTLHRFNELDLSESATPDVFKFQAGKVKIWAEKTRDINGQGTTITLSALLPRVKAILQSGDVWQAILHEEGTKRIKPLFHIGWIDPQNPGTLSVEPKLPYSSNSSEITKFKNLVDGVRIAYQVNNLYARVEHSLDNYFQMIWDLSLALPLHYVGKSPFSLTTQTHSHFFRLPHKPSSGAAEKILFNGQSIGKAAGIEDVTKNEFDLTIDGIKLFRPIDFSHIEKTSKTFQEPVLFVGAASPDLSQIPEDQRGGPLSFAAYFYWVPKLVPLEHNGVLIRIHGASGTLFDSSFLKYQVAERRLESLTGEIFVFEGLEGALNIDRESFNTAHPHYIVLSRWVHNSLKVIRNTLKVLESTARSAKRNKDAQKQRKQKEVLFADLIRETGYDVDDIPKLKIADSQQQFEEMAAEGHHVFLRDDVESVLGSDVLAERVSQIENLTRLLDAHQLLEHLSASDQAKLVCSIVKLLNS